MRTLIGKILLWFIAPAFFAWLEREIRRLEAVSAAPLQQPLDNPSGRFPERPK